MTSKNFIASVVNGQVSKEKSVSSIYYDGLDTIYSYGSHYPLLFKIAGKWILNDHGYSNTTAKHINWASEFADYRVDLLNSGEGYGYRAIKPTIANIKLSVNQELDQVTANLLKLRKGAFNKEAQLKHRLSQLEATSLFIQSLNA